MTEPPQIDDPDNFVGDEIGEWSEIKLEIIQKYAAAYSRILSKRSFHHIYIDGFAGAGQHRLRSTGEYIPGSPANALKVEPAFCEYHFVDLAHQRYEALERLRAERTDVFVHEGDANEVLVSKIFPRVRYAERRRALCLLDPYGMQLEWRVIEAAARSKTIEIFVNLPIGTAINRNVLRRDAQIDPNQADKMTRCWGDDSWRDAAYQVSRQGELFGDAALEKRTNDDIAEAFLNRLKAVAGFKHVATPIAMRNRRGAVLYYLYFGSHQPVAKKIVDDILNAYRGQGKY